MILLVVFKKYLNYVGTWICSTDYRIIDPGSMVLRYETEY